MQVKLTGNLVKPRVYIIESLGLQQKHAYLVTATVGHCDLYLDRNSAVLPEVVMQMIPAAPMWLAAWTALTALFKRNLDIP